MNYSATAPPSLRGFQFRNILRGLMYFTFWSWNILFLYLTLPFLAFVIGPLFIAVFLDEMPLDFVLAGLAIVLTVFSYTIIGIRKPYRSSPSLLFKIFYGIEIPLLMLLFFRVFFVRQLTWSSWFLLILIFCGIMFYTLWFFNRQWIESLHPIFSILGAYLMSFVGLGFATFLLFYVIPLLPDIIWYIITFQWLVDFFSMLYKNGLDGLMIFLFVCILFGVSTSVFIAFPLSFLWLYLRRAIVIIGDIGQRWSKPLVAVCLCGLLLGNILLFLQLNKQPQTSVFAILKTDPRSDEQRQNLLEQQEYIRKGLLNAYLSPYRYLSTEAESTDIQYRFMKELKLSSTSASKIQSLYNLLISPFLYQGNSMENDIASAQKLYQNFFDQPIQKAEATEIKKAIESTWDRDQISAGLLNIEDKKVYLQKQDCHISEAGSIAEIEIHEVYQNKTGNQQEIFYYFTLPETAVITGLWLGDTENRNNRFEFAVAPRGAAQEVYNREVQRRVDPALLEQVGPQQYRLRAFPIPPKLHIRGEQRVMHLWFTYVITVNEDDTWTLPHLLEKRNIFWDGDTQRSGVLKNVHWDDNVQWLPSTLKRKPTLPGNKSFSHIVKTSGDSIAKLIRFEQGMEQRQLEELPIRTAAVLIDTSKSMQKHQHHLAETMNILMNSNHFNSTFFNQHSLQIPENLIKTPENIVFYGRTSIMEMLSSWRNSEYCRKKTWDVVIIFTDEGSYELDVDQKIESGFGCPIWIVHINNVIPRAYADSVLDTIKSSGGGFARSLDDFYETLQCIEQRKTDKQFISFSNGMMIQSLDSQFHATEQSNIPDFEMKLWQKLAAKFSIEHIRLTANMNSLENLDTCHQLALSSGIVSPYSSMIVLVNDRQREALEKAEQRADRFDREIESGNEMLTKPSNPLKATGIPEPEEWLLIIVCGILLIYAFWNRKINSNSRMTMIQ